MREELAESNRHLREQLGQQKLEQSEIFAYLNKELLQKSKAVANLEGKVSNLEEEVNIGRNLFDEKLMEEKGIAREATAKLAKEVGKYEKELGDLNMFISRKTELEGELEDTKTELLRERKKHEQIISELERKTVQEKERLRKEMENKIREAKETFMKMTDSQLETTTKKTMHENEQMASELAFQNRETERLLQKNRKLADENMSTRRELAMYKQAESELARRNHAYIKTIHSLMAKLKSLEGAKKDLERVCKDKEGFISTSYKQRVTSLQDSVQETYQSLEEMRNDLDNRKSELTRLQQTKDDVALYVLQAAREVKQKLTAKPESDKSTIDEDGHDKWGVLERELMAFRLSDLEGDEKESALRYMIARISAMDIEARGGRPGQSPSGSSPRDGGQGQDGSLFPDIASKKRGTKSEYPSRENAGRAPREARTEYGSMAAGKPR